MMKKSILYILLALSPFLAVSCAKDGPDGDGFGITLTVRTPDSGVTAEVKSMPDSRNGEDAYNENLLNSFYYFFFPKDVTDQMPAVSGYVSGISETDMYKREIPVSSNTINNILFASERECRLFIVANPPSSMVDDLKGTPTLAQLREMTVLSALKTVPQSNFVMVYDGLIPVASRTQEEAVDVEVALKRLACKFTVGAYVTQSIEKNGKTYTPVTTGNGLKVTLCNGLNRTTLSGFKKSVVASSDYFDSKSIDIGYQGTGDLTENSATVTYHKYSSTVPLYTYPMEWEFASETEPYLLYDLSWKVTDNTSGDSEYKSLYYKLTLGRRSIASNDWYNIAAKLTVLGSLYPEDPTEVYPYMNYQVQGWKNAYESGGANTPAAIKDTRYLSVPQTEWVLNNKDEIVIPFSSSHDCILAIDEDYEPTGSESDPYGGLKATKTRFYYQNTAGNDKGVHTTVDVSGVSVTFPDARKEMIVSHTLNNTLGNANMDISPIKITFRIRHSDDPSFYQDIVITQYPQIYVNTVLNSSGPTDKTTNYGYAWVNNGRKVNSGSGGTAGAKDYQRIYGADGAGSNNNTTNSSRYFTIIYVSQISDFRVRQNESDASSETDVVVGDPRSDSYTDLSTYWTKIGQSSASVVAKYPGTAGSPRGLKYYYPTVDDGSRSNFVAPVLRVCTAHMRNGQNNSYAESVIRCATYQEDGYPAGRWRLPTKAECKLFQSLASNDLIPTIFLNGDYSYAGGRFNFGSQKYTDGLGINTSADNCGSPRCVYDEWYWSKVDEEFGWDNSTKTFTWGDMPRDYIHN